MNLFSPIRYGSIEARNRLAMAPLTRMRSGQSGVPGDIVVEYYRQRAGLGLIISEGTFISVESRAFAGQPGIVTDEQVTGWRRVTDAVHEAGGRIVLQLMHGGRVSHPEITGTDRIVAPSAVAIDGEVHTPTGKKRFPIPHALTVSEIGDVREEFVTAARNSMRAGFDGVEIHGANGYLLHEFLSPAANRRDDQYGGTPENRARLAIEVVSDVAEAIGADRVGMRVSPGHNIQDALETDADDLNSSYDALIDSISPLGLAYLSVLHREPTGGFVQALRSRFGGAFIANSGFGTVTTREEATTLIERSHADAVAVGRLVIANPDLVERWRVGAPENQPDPLTFYSAGSVGYIDYPTLSA